MTKNSRTNNFTIDFINKAICGSSASFKKASRGTGDVYEELVAKMNAHPDFVLKEVAAKKNTAKTTYDGLDYDFMKAYISMQTDAKILQKKMDMVKKVAKKTKNSAYPIVKKWFLKEFGEDFDMDEAKKKVKEFLEAKLISVAENDANKDKEETVEAMSGEQAELAAE